VLERPPVRLLAEAQAIIEAWRMDYNHHRPHSSLGHLTPKEFLEQRQWTPQKLAALVKDCLVREPTLPAGAVATKNVEGGGEASML